MKRIDKVRIIPLGGLNEIGKNLTLIECGKDIIAIDCGIAFPDEDLPGVDYVIPDMQYIVKNAAAQEGRTATFMPKPVAGEAGSGDF